MEGIREQSYNIILSEKKEISLKFLDGGLL